MHLLLFEPIGNTLCHFEASAAQNYYIISDILNLC